MKEYKKGYILDAPRTIAFIQAYSANKTEVLKDHRISPFYYEGLQHGMPILILKGNLQNLPPALVITAQFDPLRNDGEKYHQKLLDGGARSKLINYQTAHGFFSFCSGT